jgi:hypothetical protein
MKAQEKSFDFILCSATGDFPLGPYLKLLKPRTKFCLVGLPAVAQPLRFEPFDIVSGEKEIVGSMIGSAADQRAMLEFSAKHKCFPQCEVIDFADVSSRVVLLGGAHHRVLALCAGGGGGGSDGRAMGAHARCLERVARRRQHDGAAPRRSPAACVCAAHRPNARVLAPPAPHPAPLQLTHRSSLPWPPAPSHAALAPLACAAAGPGGHHQDARELGALPHGAQDRGLPRGQGGGAVGASAPPSQSRCGHHHRCAPPVITGTHCH